MCNKCHYIGDFVFKPDGENELDPCSYITKEIHRNVTVEISQCKNCGAIDISWHRQDNTEDEIISSIEQNTIFKLPDYDQIKFQTFIHAQTVLHLMNRIIKDYGRITLFEFYEICGFEKIIDYSNPRNKMIFDNYGWTNIVGAKILKSGGFFKLELPLIKNLKLK